MTRRECIATMTVAATSSWLHKSRFLSARPQAGSEEGGAASSDPRNIKNGSPIIEKGYCDQPYVEITKDGNWVCVVTTGKGTEGELGQHVVAAISNDKGRTDSLS